MIILLYGEDTYRLNKKLAEIIDEYRVQKKGLNFRVIDADVSSYEELVGELRQNSIFAEKKFVIVKNAFTNKAFKEKMIEGINKLPQKDSVVVVVQEGKILKTDRLLKRLREDAKTQEFTPLEGARLESWAASEAEARGLKISRSALSRLVMFVGQDLWRLSNEISKLASWAQGAKGAVAEADINRLVKSRIETDIFRTIDALAQKDKKTALKLIHEHLEKGDSHFYLLSMINFQFRNLLAVESLGETAYTGGDAKQLGMHPFVLRKAMYLSRKFSLEELKAIYRRIFKIDLDIKTGKLEPDIAIDLLIAEI